MRRFGNLLAIVLVATSLAGCSTTKQHCKQSSTCCNACEHRCNCSQQKCKQTCEGTSTHETAPSAESVPERLPEVPPPTDSNHDPSAPLPPPPMEWPSPRRP